MTIEQKIAFLTLSLGMLFTIMFVFEWVTSGFREAISMLAFVVAILVGVLMLVFVSWWAVLTFF